MKKGSSRPQGPRRRRPRTSDSGAKSAVEVHLALLTQVLTLIAADSTLAEILTAIVRHVEAESPDSLCSVLLLDDAGAHLLTGAAPSLPDFYNDAVHGMAIGAGRGSCGSAAFLDERVIVEEIRSHPWWADFKELAARAGLESCWSEPIHSSAGQVLGTFAVYHRRPHIPTGADLATIALAGQLAAIAIERHRADEALRLSDERFRGIFENAPVAIYKSSRDGRILAANPAFATLLGYDSVDEVLALDMAEDVYLDPRERERLIAVYEPGGSVANLDIVWKRKDGTPVEIRLDSHVIRDASGRTVAYDGFVADVTTQKRHERSLRESEDRYRDLVENSRDLICTHDLAGQILSINPWAAKMLGRDRDVLLQMNLRDVIAPEVRNRFDAYLEEIERHGAARGLLLLETATGGRRIWEYNNTLRTAGVEAPVVRGIGRDVTERVEAERLQKAIHQIFESGHTATSLPDLFRSIHQIIGKLLPARNFYVALNDEGADQMSFPYFVDEFDTAPTPSKRDGLTGEVLRTGKALLITSDLQAPWIASGKTVLGTPPLDWLGVPLRSQDRVIGALAVQSYSGEVRYTEHHRALLQLVSNQVGSTIARKQAETALRESEERYHRVVDNIGDALLIDDVEGRVVYANDRFLDLFGLERAELQDLVLEDYIAPEFRAALRERHDRRMRAEEVPNIFEYEGVRRDGTRIQLEVRVSTIVENGVVLGTQSAIRDISEREQAEKTKADLEARLRQAAKMEAVGSLAGGVAHDFNNMLAVILGNTEIALAEVDAEQPLHSSLQQIRLAAERSVALTRQLLAFARKQTIRPRELDLNETVASMLRMLERLIGENLELVWKPGGGLWPVKMDPAQVDQVLANLAVNARDAIEGSGTLTISTRNLGRDEAAQATHGELGLGDHVLLEVSDSGVGMDDATLGRLFEPFFTTKEVGKGTGMGLATVYGIVQQNQGAIRVASAPGRGATISIFLPRARGVPAAEVASAEPQAARGTETVLLVEDEAAVLDLSRRILERAGFTVLAARTPAEAMKLADRSGGAIQLLLTDVMLPGMSGKELKEKLEHLCPGIRCLYTSGYTADVIAHRGVLEDDVHFLAKPFSITALVAKVREVLDAGSGLPDL